MSKKIHSVKKKYTETKYSVSCLHVSLFYNIYFHSLLSSLHLYIYTHTFIYIFCNVSKILINIFPLKFQWWLWAEWVYENKVRHVYDLTIKTKHRRLRIWKHVCSSFGLNVMLGWCVKFVLSEMETWPLISVNQSFTLNFDI